MELSIAWFYPDLMSTYGDRGNITALVKRCEWRGIEVEVREITLETDTSKLAGSDLVFMGGAQDRQQKLAAEDLRKNKGPWLKKLIGEGMPGLFICGAYQFLGKFYKPAEGPEIPGLGIFDLSTVHPGSDSKRLVGNAVIQVATDQIKPSTFNLQLPSLVGFENHGGRTFLGQNVKPLGKVIRGFGNNGKDGTEGAIYKNAIGSYLHGPLLPKNPHLADWLIERALTKKYGEVKLEELNDELEWRTHNSAAKLS